MEPTDSHRISAAPELGSDDTPDEALVGMKTPKLSAENKRMIRGNLMCVLFEQVRPRVGNLFASLQHVLGRRRSHG